MENLYPSRPSLGNDELEAVQRVFDSNWLGMGTFVCEFETAIEKYIGSGIAIAVNSGTSALHLALESIGVKKGDEVIVPSLTFCASVQVITALGAKPVFCEVSPNDLCIDVKDAESKISSKTKAIIPVHYCGIACQMDALLRIKNEYGIRIVEDAAHAFGTSYKCKLLGSFGDICCFSFDPIKNITCGEGGAIIVRDDNHANLIRKKRQLGIDRDGWLEHSNNKRQKEYDVVTQGYRYHMSNINAAIGLAQMKKINDFRYKKIELVKRYNQRLTKIKGISVLRWNLSENFPFAYVIKVLDNHRDKLKIYLENNGIHPGLNYIPNHMQSFFHEAIHLPVTEQVFQEIITLPLYHSLGFEEVEYILNCIEEYFSQQDSSEPIPTEKEVYNG